MQAMIKKLQLGSETPTTSTRRVERSVCAVPLDARMHMPHISGETNSTVEVHRLRSQQTFIFWGCNERLMAY